MTPHEVSPRLMALAFRACRSRITAGLALALLAGGVGVQLVVLPRLDRALADATRAANEAARFASPRPVSRIDETPAIALARWRAALPATARRQPRVAALLSLATANGLAPKRAEFRLGTEASLGIARYRITLPLTGRYAALRLFMESALAADPALLLDSVRLDRSSVATPDLNAQFTFSLLMRTDGEPPPASTTRISVADDDLSSGLAQARR